MTMTALYPSTAASAAMPMPVLPLVGSMMRAAGDERAVRRRGAYHAQRGAVLGAAGGVEALQLGQDVKPRGKAARRMSGVEPIRQVISL